MTLAVAPPADLQLRVTDAATGLYQLAVRRQAWLDTTLQVGAEGGVAELGAALDSALGAVPEHVEVLRAAFAAHPEWCTARIAAELASGRFSVAEVEALTRAADAADGDWAAAAERLAPSVVGAAENSRAAMRAQLEAGATPLAFDGLGTGCGMVAFGAMGGLLFCAKTAGAGCAVGGAAMIALAAFC